MRCMRGHDIGDRNVIEARPCKPFTLRLVLAAIVSLAVTHLAVHALFSHAHIVPLRFACVCGAVQVEARCAPVPLDRTSLG